MTEIIEPSAPKSQLFVIEQMPSTTGRTPANLQNQRDLTLRRLFMLLINLITLTGIMIGVAMVFAGDGIDAP